MRLLGITGGPDGADREKQGIHRYSIELVLHGGEKALAVTNANGYLFIGDLDLAFADVLDLADGDDIAAMRAYEFPRRQFLGNGLQRHERENGLAREVDLYIVVETFDVEDLFQVDLYHLIIGLDKDVAFL